MIAKIYFHLPAPENRTERDILSEAVLRSEVDPRRCLIDGGFGANFSATECESTVARRRVIRPAVLGFSVNFGNLILFEGNANRTKQGRHLNF